MPSVDAAHPLNFILRIFCYGFIYFWLCDYDIYCLNLCARVTDSESESASFAHALFSVVSFALTLALDAVPTFAFI